MQDLSQADPVKVDHLLAAWQQGNLILVLRHLERCDRADVPCLNDDPNGITQRSTEVGRGLAEDFLSLGLDHADIYYSPLARTAQTAAVVFGERAEARDWLYHCRQDDSLLGAALEFKLAARNLILVTHSSCIDAFERQLGFSSDTPAYGTALFLTKEQPRRDLRLFGLVEPEDWEQIFFSD